MLGIGSGKSNLQSLRMQNEDSATELDTLKLLWGIKSNMCSGIWAPVLSVKRTRFEHTLSFLVDDAKVYARGRH